VKDKNGNITINPNSGWNTLTSDPELQDLNLEFVLYQVGQAPNGKTYKADSVYTKRLQNGVPFLQLQIPNRPDLYVPMNLPVKSWNAVDSFKLTKDWIIKNLKKSPFAEYLKDGSMIPAPRMAMSAPVDDAPKQVQADSFPTPAPKAQSLPVARMAQRPKPIIDEYREGEVEPIRAVEVSSPYQNGKPISTLGLGTIPVKAPPIVTPLYRAAPALVIQKRPSRFLPSNYDE